MRKFLHKIIYLPIYILSTFFPRSSKRVAIGCYKNLFLDNSKYFFLELSKDPNFEVAWITNSQKVYDEISKLGLKVYFRHSLSGIFFTMTSKYFVYSSYVSDVHEYTFRGAKLINLWHGFPIRHIEYDIKEGPLSKIFSEKVLYKGYLSNYHFVYQKPDLMFARSRLEAKIFANAFLISKSVIALAFPQRLIGAKDTHPTKILIAPTWSDSGDKSDFVKLLISFDKFCGTIADKPPLIFKQHPNDNFDYTTLNLGNIEILEKNSDIYEILPTVAFLISDFSSLVLDFIALEKSFGLVSGVQNVRGTYLSKDDFKGRVFENMELAMSSYINGDCDSMNDINKDMKCSCRVSMVDVFKNWASEVVQ